MPIKILKDAKTVRRWKGYSGDPAIVPVDYLVMGSRYYKVTNYGIDHDYYAENDTSATYEEAYQEMLDIAVAELKESLKSLRYAQETVDKIHALSPTRVNDV